MEANEPGPFHVIKDGVVYELQSEPEGGYTIWVPVLPGCSSFGETIDDALIQVLEAVALWVEFARERELFIPPPFDAVKQGS